MFKTPGALEVVLRLAVSFVSFGGEEEMPAMAESTFVRSDVSADMMYRLGRLKSEGRGRRKVRFGC